MNYLGYLKHFIPHLKATYTQGHKNDGTSLLAIQPFSAILGLGYQSSNDKWNLLFTGRYVAKKRTKDAMDISVANSLKLDVDKQTGK